MSEAMLRFEGVDFAYDGALVLREIDRQKPIVSIPVTLMKIAGFLAQRQSDGASEPAISAITELEDVPEVMADGLLASELQSILDYVEKTRSIPFEIDRQLLALSRNALGRNLNEEEKQYVRAEFRACVQDRVDELAGLAKS